MATHLVNVKADESRARAPWGWATFGALSGVALATLIWAPASWLAQVLAQATQQQVQLLEPRGTVWRGSAQLLFSAGVDSKDSTALPTRLHWSLHPTLSGIQASVSSDCCTPAPLDLQLRPHLQGLQVTASDGQVQLPAQVLSGLGTPWNTIDLQGQLRLATQRLQLQWQAGRLHSSGSLRLEALSISSRLSPLRPLGSYRLDITGGDSPQLALSTLQGDLQLSGQGQWVGSRLHFQGEASASPEREAVLSNLLNILGRRQGARSLIIFG